MLCEICSYTVLYKYSVKYRNGKLLQSLYIKRDVDSKEVGFPTEHLRDTG